jgi:hypothetical protein
MDQRDDRSLENVRSDVARARAGLTDTVDELRQRMSPEALRAEANDYFQKRGDRLLDLARQNPLEATAIGALAAYPLLGVARSLPVPVLMVGAGLFLLSSTGRDASRRVAAMATDNIRDGANAAREKMRAVQDYGADRVNAASASVAASTEAVRQKVSAAGESLADAGRAAVRVAGDAGAEAQSASDTATAPETLAGVQQRASEAWIGRRRLFAAPLRTTPLLIGGIGVAVGALVASALPSSDCQSAPNLALTHF